MGLNIVRAAVECAIPKLVNIMPNCTYPGEAEIYRESDWWNGPMHETVLTYGMPRKALWVQAWAHKMQNRLHSIHLVLPNLFGPNDHFDIVRSHALGALIRKVVDAKCSGRREVEIWGTGKPVREWMYVEDAAEAVIAATASWDNIEILNLGSGQSCSIQELAEMIREAADWVGEFHCNIDFPDGAPCKILDLTRMREQLEWRPRVTLHDGILRTVRWYLEHRSRYLPLSASA
jgi:GDP-L-fucose synthase